MSVNKFIGIGNLGRDPEMRFMPNGNAVCNFSIAISEKYKDKVNGDWKEVTEWVNVVMFGKLAEIAGEYLKKGSKVYVEGKLKTEKYTDKQGVEKFSTKVVAEKMDMLNTRTEGAAPAKTAPPEPEPFNEDEIPF
jgi:single-strand DNA-binding protein